MPHAFTRSVRRGAVRLSCTWEADANESFAPAHSGGEGRMLVGLGLRPWAVSVGVQRSLAAGSFVGISRVVHGRRLGHGQRCSRLRIPRSGGACPDARTLVRHREAFKMAWHRKWGPPIGLWHLEFQPRKRRPEHQRHAPHLHMYLGLPERIDADEFAALQRRTIRRHWMEERFGKYEGRCAGLEAPEGEFADWMLATWWRIVGSGHTMHLTRGADITLAFWSDDVEAVADRAAIADYFWRESGKFGQKTPPGDFGGLRFWGVWGERHGFVEVEGASRIDRLAAFFKERRIYRRLVENSCGRSCKVRSTTRGYRTTQPERVSVPK